MPRPRPRAKQTEKPKTPRNSVVDRILSDFGQVLISGDELITQTKRKVPISPAFDFAHNGGLQEGTFVVFAGPPRCGKTTTALHFAGNSQLPEHGSHKVVYLNAESRLESRDLQGIAQIKTDPEHFVIVQSSPPSEDDAGEVTKPGKILTAKDFLLIAERFLMQTVRHVIILDSISAMIGESEWSEGLNSIAIGEAQKLFSKFMRRMAQVITTNQHIFIGIVHLYANIGGGPGPKWHEKMSNSAQYGLASKFRSTHWESWSTGVEKNKNIIGQVGHWRCERSPLGQPGIVFNSYLRYGSGIDEIKEIISYATDLKFIDKPDKSSWYEMRFVDVDQKPKLQGEESVKAYLIDHPEELANLKRLVYEGLGI